jgi:hypothetical protein
MKFSTRNWDDALLIFFGALTAIYLEKSLAFGINLETALFWFLLFGATWVCISILRLVGRQVLKSIRNWVYRDRPQV